jgi:hypothetical protein
MPRYLRMTSRCQRQLNFYIQLDVGVVEVSGDVDRKGHSRDLSGSQTQQCSTPYCRLIWKVDAMKLAHGIH